MADKKALVLAAGSILATLVASELALRVLTPFGSSSNARPGKVAPTAASPDLQNATRYVSRMPATYGTDRRWFSEDPAPLQRGRVDPKEQERSDDFVRRGLGSREAQFVFNRVLLGYSGCTASGPFQKFPDVVPAFDPPSRTLHPPFRLPPDTTTPEGLVTNHFGFRGPQIELLPPPKTIRVAFAGASTTINQHTFAFSYPERTVFWLNRFAAANHYGVNFEVINAGREGITSEDIAAIVRYEVAPLEPDLVVYYEGANQFLANSLMVPYIPRREALDPNDKVTGHKLPDWVRRLALGDLADRALLGVTSAGEPRKPAYRLNWPPTVNENHPNPDNRDLPLELPRIVKDLDDIRSVLKPGGAELAVCSFERLAHAGMVLSPVAHRYIYGQLNTLLWPLWYSDIRRLADFQNRVFRAYAESRQTLFLDVAAAMPQDPALFVDSIHMTETGERVKAWIVFQQLAPYFRKRIESGQLPRTRRGPVLPPPSIPTLEVRRCEEPGNLKYELRDSLSLNDLQTPKDATLDRTSPMKLTTSDRQWGYELTMPLTLLHNAGGHLYFKFHARVLKGHIGVGVMDGSGGFQGERVIDAASSASNVYVPIAIPETARSIILRNTAAGHERSEIIFDTPVVVSDRQQ